jgi:hypothetical protein
MKTRVGENTSTTVNTRLTEIEETIQTKYVIREDIQTHVAENFTLTETWQSSTSLPFYML